MPTIKIGKLPGGKLRELDLKSGSTVGHALQEAGLDSEGFEVRNNGELVDNNAQLQNGDTVILAKKIRGNE